MTISSSLIVEVRENFRLNWHGVHGVSHWARVRFNGLLLANESGAIPRVIEYFAFLHDSCRENESSDPKHGLRAVDFARSIRSRCIDLNDREFELLLEAMAGHTHGTGHEDVTVATCWDADRLDLARVGIDPDPRRLLNRMARRRDVIRNASDRATTWLNGYLKRRSERRI
jgi:uncharacterized protein